MDDTNALYADDDFEDLEEDDNNDDNDDGKGYTKPAPSGTVAGTVGVVAVDGEGEGTGEVELDESIAESIEEEEMSIGNAQVCIVSYTYG